MSYSLFESRVDQYNRTYRQVRGRERPKEVLLSKSDADVISKTRGFLGAFDFTMQLQVGCPGGCLFCYVSAAPRLAPTQVRRRWGFEVRIKKSPLEKLHRYLQSGELAGKSLYWSAVTDPYAAKRDLTEDVWKLFCETDGGLRPKRVVIQSRFRPDRDRELMARYITGTMSRDGGPPLVVSYTIGTDRSDIIHAWERATPTFEQRMGAIQRLREADVFVVPTLSPFSLWNDLEVTLGRFREWKIPFITVLFFKNRTRYANTPKEFLAHLEETYPFLLEPSWQKERVEELKSIYGKDRVLVGQKAFAALSDPPVLTCPDLI